MPQSKPRVVILGAGFGGLEATKTLRRAPVEIILIDRQNYHWLPARPEALKFQFPALFSPQFWSKTIFMEYKGVRYTIHIGIERQQWCVALYPPGNEFPEEKRISGTREDAERKVHLMIDAWLRTRLTRMKKANADR